MHAFLTPFNLQTLIHTTGLIILKMLNPISTRFNKWLIAELLFLVVSNSLFGQPAETKIIISADQNNSIIN